MENSAPDYQYTVFSINGKNVQAHKLRMQTEKICNSIKQRGFVGGTMYYDPQSFSVLWRGMWNTFEQVSEKKPCVIPPRTPKNMCNPFNNDTLSYVSVVCNNVNRTFDVHVYLVKVDELYGFSKKYKMSESISVQSADKTNDFLSLWGTLHTLSKAPSNSLLPLQTP